MTISAGEMDTLVEYRVKRDVPTQTGTTKSTWDDVELTFYANVEDIVRHLFDGARSYTENRTTFTTWSPNVAATADRRIYHDGDFYEIVETRNLGRNAQMQIETRRVID